MLVCRCIYLWEYVCTCVECVCVCVCVVVDGIKGGEV